MINHLLQSLNLGLCERTNNKIFSEISWEDFNCVLLTDQQERNIKTLAIKKLFDLVFIKQMSEVNEANALFIEQIKNRYKTDLRHTLVLLEYLRRFCPKNVPVVNECISGTPEYTGLLSLKDLFVSFQNCMTWGHWYQCARQWHSEPLIKNILTDFARQELHLAVEAEQDMKMAIERFAEEARIEISKTAAKKLDQAKPTTNLQSKEICWVKSPETEKQLLEKRLFLQAGFDQPWNDKLRTVLFEHISGLLGQSIRSASQLMIYRKSLIAASYNQGGFY